MVTSLPVHVWTGVLLMLLTGHDPATDLRGVGFLSLVQLLYFVTESKCCQLARNVYTLSQHPTQACISHISTDHTHTHTHTPSDTVTLTA